MKYNVLHPHCGPFNSISSGTTSRVDSICRTHDMEYNDEIARKGYIHTYTKFNKADAKFIKNMPKGLAQAYTIPFRIKKMINGGELVDNLSRRRVMAPGPRERRLQQWKTGLKRMNANFRVTKRAIAAKRGTRLAVRPVWARPKRTYIKRKIYRRGRHYRKRR